METIGKPVSKPIALYTSIDEDGFGAAEMKKQLHELQAREESTLAELEEVATGIVASRQASIKSDNIKAICHSIQTVLKNATFDERQALFSEFGLQFPLYPSGEHVMKINLNVEPSGEIAHPSLSEAKGFGGNREMQSPCPTLLCMPFAFYTKNFGSMLSADRHNPLRRY